MGFADSLLMRILSQYYVNLTFAAINLLSSVERTSGRATQLHEEFKDFVQYPKLGKDDVVRHFLKDLVFQNSIFKILKLWIF